MKHKGVENREGTEEQVGTEEHKASVTEEEHTVPHQVVSRWGRLAWYVNIGRVVCNQGEGRLIHYGMVEGGIHGLRALPLARAEVAFFPALQLCDGKSQGAKEGE